MSSAAAETHAPAAGIPTKSATRPAAVQISARHRAGFIARSLVSSSVPPELRQVGVDKRIDRAVHHRRDVADLRFRPFVADQRVGLEGVAADVVSELDRTLVTAQL